MSQHDLSIANQGFPAFRSDLNDALQALGSMQSGTSAPSTTYANMLWYDTTNNIVKMRNEDNDAWISLFTLDQSGDLVSAISATTGTFGTLSATGNVTLGDSSSDTATVNAKTTFGSEISAPNTFSFKNRLINSDMRIDQRNAGASVTLTASTSYIVDRFGGVEDTDGGMTGQQSSQAPEGFTKSIVFTTTSADASLGSTQYCIGVQRIEGNNVSDLGWGTAVAKTVTMSFWVRSSLTGTFSGSLVNSAADRSYPFTYTISSANTWEQKSVTIAGDTSGTWLTDNGIGIRVHFCLGAGSSYLGTANAWASGLLFGATGTTSVIGTNSATFYITGVQLEKGSTATSFDYRPYGTELALCQRYYYLIASGATKSIGMGSYQTSTYMEGFIQFPTTMRSTPALECVSGTSYYGMYVANSNDLVNSFTAEYMNVNGSTIYNTTEASGTTGQAGWFNTNNASSKIAFSSEL